MAITSANQLELLQTAEAVARESHGYRLALPRESPSPHGRGVKGA